MAVYLWQNSFQQFFDQNGDPLSGGKLYFFAAGSSVKQNTFTTSSGAVPNANPLILDAAGYTQQAIWLTGGLLYKVGLTLPTEPDPPTNFITPWPLDNVRGIGDTTSTVSEWLASGFTPTYISATSFTVPGDQTSVLNKSRRVNIIDAGGTKYGTIVNSVFTTLTTVTVAIDNGGILSSPIASVAYGIIDGANPSIDADQVNRKASAVVAAATTDIWSTAGNTVHVTGATGPITSLGTAPYSGAKRTIIWDSTPAVTYNAATLQIPGAQSVTVAAGDRWEVTADTTANMIVTSIVKAAGVQTLTLPRDYISGFTLTTASTTTYDVAAGQGMDSTNSTAINGGALSGKSQAAWAVGGAAGGKLSVAAMANATWYYWFALLKDSDGTVDYGFDVSTTPTMPTGYTKFRYIGARKTAAGASTWETFIQHGDQVAWSTPPALDVNGTALSTANRTLTTMNIPAVRVEWYGRALQRQIQADAGIILTDPLCADVGTSSATVTPLGDMVLSTNIVTSTLNVGGQVRCWANASSQIGVRGMIGGVDVAYIQTMGWIDPRGKPV